jgi:hypothetical protein
MKQLSCTLGEAVAVVEQWEGPTLAVVVVLG